MKIYTKTGDAGITGLVDGSRVPKSHGRIAAVGALDEANAALGVVSAMLPTGHVSCSLLIQSQSWLFSCGAHVADPSNGSGLVNLPDHEVVCRYEASIDQMEQGLPPLRQFILPGGTLIVAHIHVARTAVRRAERAVVALSDAGVSVDKSIVVFLNRLSDWLFVLSRLLHAEAGVADVVWDPTLE